MNYRDILVEKLKKYSKDKIIITDHALRQAIFRNIDPQEVINNILSPEKLSFARKEKSISQGEEKYDCYF